MKILLITIILPFTLAALSLEEKVGQLFMVHFVGESANDDAKRLLEEAHVGGFILYDWANKLESLEQIKKLTEGLQSLTDTPLFIAADQEGGPVRRLQFSPDPSNQSVGETGDPHKAYEQAMAISQTLKSCGINFNFAPVADISESQGINPERCYGSDPNQVALFVQEALAGYRKSSIISCLKHFPGHGSVNVDSHEATPVQKKSLEELMKSDLIPFHGGEVIMTAHVIVGCLDLVYPATFSSRVLQDFLRKDLHFEGVIISDSLVMNGATNHLSSLSEATKKAFLAGCDILLFGGQNLQLAGRNEMTVDEILTIYRAFLEAVHTGEITEAQIDESVGRILKLKKKYLLGYDPING